MTLTRAASLCSQRNGEYLSVFNSLFRRDMQIGLTVDNKKEDKSNDAHDNVSPNVDSLSTKLKHNLSKR